jgi:Flp pilus assembly protein TadB
MAQTKKKRQTKHRGNAAGQVQARGRTGRKPTETERKGTSKGDARARRLARLDQPPTWRGALNRAFLATGMFLVLLLLFFRSQQIGAKLGIAAFMLLLYVPLGYYTDLFIYRRRQARKLRDEAAKRPSDGS